MRGKAVSLFSFCLFNFLSQFLFIIIFLFMINDNGEEGMKFEMLERERERRFNDN